ncbi:MAG: FAD-dependent protein [Chitinophagaceae bacterium]
MQKTLTLKLLPSEAASDHLIKEYIAKAAAVKLSSVTGFLLLKSSIDARGKQTWVNISLKAFIDEPWQPRESMNFEFPQIKNSKHKVVIIGAGPAGLFAALYLIQNGIKPILLERGKDIRSRRRDLAILNKEGKINPESNYCFGEGGAGTYSDGKLYTRSTKRGDINRILNLFVHFGAEEKILYESHPHIGTNKLPQIITAMRKKILDCGGELEFEKKVIDLIIKNDKLSAVKTADGFSYEGDSVILATGHSARDIFHFLNDRNINIEFKPFSLGVRVEHPQEIIDNIQYHISPQFNVSCKRDPFLPAASYSLVQQVNGKGVFSFCMCPGGIIAPAATNEREIVVNGWSPSKRNNPYANSGIVVSVDEKDVQAFKKHGPLAGMYFQQSIEEKAFEKGGGKFVAPAQRLVDFTENRLSSSLPECSYLPGITSVPLKQVLPNFIHTNIQHAFKEFGKKMRGYLTNEAVVVATESRTSSPVRIPRDNDSLQHPRISNLYPCGEGAGYAGGIVSAAMDGERVAHQIVIKLNKM